MPANKNALIRYKTLDRCLRNRYRRYTIDDLIEECSNALYEMEGIDKGISKRTIQGDINVMRSGKLGYYAPIEVYDGKYYQYSDPDYSISDNPLTNDDYVLIKETMHLIEDGKVSSDLNDICIALAKVKARLAMILAI